MTVFITIFSSMPIRQTFPKSDRVTGLSADTPYEGREIVGWPIEVYSGGRCVVRDNTLQVEAGT